MNLIGVLAGVDDPGQLADMSGSLETLLAAAADGLQEDSAGVAGFGRRTKPSSAVEARNRAAIIA